MLEWLGRIFGRRQVGPEYQPEYRHVQFGNVTVGINVHAPEEFLKVSTVWRCVQLKSNAVATLPWDVMRPTAAGGKERVRKPAAGSEIADILNRRPNPEMTAFSFRTTVMQHKLLYGNFYGEIEFDMAGRPIAIWPIAPDRVEPCRDEVGSLFYRVSNPRGGMDEIDPSRVFHVPGLSWDGVRGYSVLEVGMQSLGGAYAMERFAGRYFGSGMQTSGIVEVPPGIVLGKDGVETLRAEFKRRFQGWQNAQEPVILDQGMKYTPAQTEPDKSQLLDTRKFSVFDVCRWFGVPPYLAFASDEEPRANVETQSREFLMYGLDPEIVALEQEADRKLFGAYKQDLTTRMNTDEFQRGDLKSRSEFYTAMRHLGVFSVNDILELEGRDTIGPEGDVRVMQVQFQPIGPDGAPASIEPQPAPEQDRQEDDGEDDIPPPPAAKMNGKAHAH